MDEPRKRGRPPKPPEQRAKKKSGKGGKHEPPTAAQLAELDRLIAAATADVPADVRTSRATLAEQRLKLTKGSLTQARTRRPSELTIERWRAALARYIDCM
jgi:hypothetical protein